MAYNEVVSIFSNIKQLQEEFNNYVLDGQSKSHLVEFTEDLNIKGGLNIDDELLDLNDGTLPCAVIWSGEDCTEDSEKTCSSAHIIPRSDSPPVDISDVIASVAKLTPWQTTPHVSTKTFVRPKKGRSSLSALVASTPARTDANNEPKMRRRLTTTINPSPALIPHLQELSLVGNRPVSGGGDLRWEDGAPCAPAELNTTVNSRPSRLVVSASILQRLQEIKAENGVPKTDSPCRSPIRPSEPVLLSQIPGQFKTFGKSTRSPFLNPFNDIPDMENAVGPESFMSLNESSFISLGDGGIMSMTNSIHGNVLDSTFTKDEEKENGLAVDQNLLIMNTTFEKDKPDENRNSEAELCNNTMRVSEMNSTTTVTRRSFYGERSILKKEEYRNKSILDESIVEKDQNFDLVHLQNTYNKDRTSVQSNGRSSSGSLQNGTYTFSPPIEAEGSAENVANFSTKTITRSPRSRLAISSSRTSLHRSVDDLRASRLKKGPIGSDELLSRSPTRSDGTVTPVETRMAYGTYTRNSPVERCGSEDERMSTTSDHSSRSQGSVEDLPAQSTKRERGMSTPTAFTAPKKALGEWEISPITLPKNQSSPVSSHSNSRLGLSRRDQVPHGPAPIKPALIQPTDNFKRPQIKKTLGSAMRVPTKSEPALNTISARPSLTSMHRLSLVPASTKPVKGIPKPVSKLPSRLSSIPRPPGRAQNASFTK